MLKQMPHGRSWYTFNIWSHEAKKMFSKERQPCLDSFDWRPDGENRNRLLEHLPKHCAPLYQKELVGIAALCFIPIASAVVYQGFNLMQSCIFGQNLQLQFALLPFEHKKKQHIEKSSGSFPKSTCGLAPDIHLHVFWIWYDMFDTFSFSRIVDISLSRSSSSAVPFKKTWRDSYRHMPHAMSVHLPTWGLPWPWGYPQSSFISNDGIFHETNHP